MGAKMGELDNTDNDMEGFYSNCNFFPAVDGFRSGRFSLPQVDWVGNRRRGWIDDFMYSIETIFY